jgi:hypothetical protein
LAGSQSVPEGGPSTWLMVATILALFVVHKCRQVRQENVSNAHSV